MSEKESPQHVGRIHRDMEILAQPVIDKRSLTLQADVLTQLDELFATVAMADIGMVAEAVESRLLRSIEEVLLEQTRRLVQGSSPYGEALEAISTEAGPLFIKAQESFDNPNELLVGYLLLEQDAPSASRETIDISGYGKYDQVVLLAPESVSVDLDTLSDIVQTLVRTHYSWLFGRFKEVVKESGVMANRIYSQLRIITNHDPELAGVIWLVAMHGDHCFFLIDEQNATGALELLKRHGVHPNMSPISLVSEFLTMRLPFSKSFAIEASRAGKCIDGKIENSAYYDDMTLLALSQLAVFTNHVSVCPLLAEGDTYLFASFPTRFRPKLEGLFEIHKGKLGAEYLQFARRFRKLMTTIERSKKQAGYTHIGEFIGRTMGGFLRGYSD